ncbi:MAG TPA: hypothetical protein VGQ55_01525 [Pyrinomonadaceae bacterium]|nr:hypothetical protein [Pyrinomonadaceae bacterium]
MFKRSTALSTDLVFILLAMCGLAAAQGKGIPSHSGTLVIAVPV